MIKKFLPEFYFFIALYCYLFVCLFMVAFHWFYSSFYDSLSIPSLEEKAIQLGSEVSFVFPAAGRITSKYGPRRQAFHYGVDIGHRKGRNIRAAASGKVIFTRETPRFGKTIVIKHTDSVRSLYAHLEKISVKENQLVKQEQLIGIMGGTGRSRGIHLHFEVMVNGRYVNPLKLLSPR